MDGSVSVVTPAYRAAASVATAVRSALDQPETHEVILVEDGSPDDTLAACRRLAAGSPGRVALLRHEGGANRGASASRNLGIARAHAPFVAFLDADDAMLPGRFAVSVPRLHSDPTADGVYEAVAVESDDESLPPDRGWGSRARLLTMPAGIEPEALLGALLAGVGDIHTNGIVVRREVFAVSAGFNPRLRIIGDDTEMWWRLAAVARLVPGRLDEPVAVYRRHAENSFAPSHPLYREAGFRAALEINRWARRQPLPPETRDLLRRLLRSQILAWRGPRPAWPVIATVWLNRLMEAACRVPAALLAPAAVRQAAARLRRRQPVSPRLR